MLDKAQAKEAYEVLNSGRAFGGLVGQVNLVVTDPKGRVVDLHSLYDGITVGDTMFNTTLNTAKKVFSHAAIGDTNYKIAKIAFGNAGHNFDDPRFPIDPTPDDVELKSAQYIRESLNDADDAKHFLYTDDNGVSHRMVYVEKDIIASEHISFGENGDQIIITVPMAYDDFNYRVGGANDDTSVRYQDDLISYDLINDADGSLIQMRNVDANGVPEGTDSEIYSWDDSGTRRYLFKNGLDANGNIDTTNGGYRPQEISEILLLSDITGTGTAEDPYEKLATSRITTGLLTYPAGFSFSFQWILTWNFS
jgi:hypothetical protein